VRLIGRSPLSKCVCVWPIVLFLFYLVVAEFVSPSLLLRERPADEPQHCVEPAGVEVGCVGLWVWVCVERGGRGGYEREDEMGKEV
jgi:hypothetical protein